MKIGTSIAIIVLIANLANCLTKNSYKCSNPNNNFGICISLYDCPTVLKVFLKSKRSAENERFLQQSFCENGFGASPFVCCTNEFSISNETLLQRPEQIENEDNLLTTQTVSIETKKKLLPTQAECTRAGYLSLAVWKLTMSKALCVGSLINSRYILTSAWCAANARRELVHLGKSNTNDVKIETRIAHESYTYSDDYQFDHDIGLLRLSRNVQFNAEVAPSCLPSTINGFRNYHIGDGIQFAVRSGNNVNIHAVGTIVNKCKDNKSASPNQLCVSGDISTYYWSFEYGAPIVAKYNGAWVVGAVYSFHRTPEFAILARVSDYENWILENIEQ